MLKGTSSCKWHKRCCFAKIFAKILLHVFGYSLCTERHRSAHFCQMLLPLKAARIVCEKSCCSLAQKLMLKLIGPSNEVFL
jgi:hypothetical protein